MRCAEFRQGLKLAFFREEGLFYVKSSAVNDSLSDSYHQLIEYDRKQLIVLLIPIVDIHSMNFQRTEIYSKIPCLTRSFNYNEQDILIRFYMISFLKQNEFCILPKFVYLYPD